MIDLTYFRIAEWKLLEWQQTYHPLNVEGELRKMKDWLNANPRRRKKHYNRFVVNWLNKAHAQVTSAQVQARMAARVGKSSYEGTEVSPKAAELSQLLDDYYQRNWKTDEQGRRYLISPATREKIFQC